jgi:hypothetical protein
MPKPKYNADIFGALIADHDKHRALLNQIEATTGASPERKALFEELTHEIKGHAVAEHHEMDELLNDLAATDMATGAWLTKFRTVKEEYLHHTKEEEGELFPDVEKHLDDADRKYMASVFKRRKQAEKTKAEVTPEKKKG